MRPRGSPTASGDQVQLLPHCPRLEDSRTKQPLGGALKNSTHSYHGGSQKHKQEKAPPRNVSDQHAAERCHSESSGVRGLLPSRRRRVSTCARGCGLRREAEDHGPEPQPGTTAGLWHCCAGNDSRHESEHLSLQGVVISAGQRVLNSHFPYPTVVVS